MTLKQRIFSAPPLIWKWIIGVCLTLKVGILAFIQLQSDGTLSPAPPELIKYCYIALAVCFAVASFGQVQVKKEEPKQ